MFQGWCDSPGHYANLIDPDYEEMGLAAVPVGDCTSIHIAKTGQNVPVGEFAYKFYVQTFGGGGGGGDIVPISYNFRIIPMKIGQDGA